MEIDHIIKDRIETELLPSMDDKYSFKELINKIEKIEFELIKEEINAELSSLINYKKEEIEDIRIKIEALLDKIETDQISYEEYNEVKDANNALKKFFNVNS